MAPPDSSWWPAGLAEPSSSGDQDGMRYAFFARERRLAVQRDGQGPYVLTVGGDGKVAQKRVETVAVVDNDWVVSSGLEDGDQVIVSGLQKVQPGAPAKAAVVPAPGAAPANPPANPPQQPEKPDDTPATSA